MIKKTISLPLKASQYRIDRPPTPEIAVSQAEPLGQVLTVTTVPTKIQDALVIVCFSEFCEESTQPQKDQFFERLTGYIANQKPIIFLNADEDWCDIDSAFLKRHMPQSVAQLWNKFGTQDRFRQFCAYESVLAHLDNPNTIEIGGSYKEFCVTMCAVNICKESITTSMDELTLPFEASELDENHQWIRIPHGVISDIMSVSAPPIDRDYESDSDTPLEKRHRPNPSSPSAPPKTP
jgi:hypothetical protein